MHVSARSAYKLKPERKRYPPCAIRGSTSKLTFRFAHAAVSMDIRAPTQVRTVTRISAQASLLDKPVNLMSVQRRRRVLNTVVQGLTLLLEQGLGPEV